ncbi:MULTISPECIES: PilN domain-containing protein [Vitreoscilla]|uniref:PilN domain-containing protein n=1 Tax=Vitreoscilla stercoraria TaxID=61 RepID=A0ABY4EHV2_VITST|nr:MULTISPECIES: PilN domain-containing protein [Vitreoscilla]AUZ05616.2 hypothetical protein ADP71_22240 [Vitreoscilla sp. C1]UOO92967.1 PilN domain-containing protein [Vitreoscilla stercoraria]
MIKIVKLNLLDYRAEAKKEQLKKFQILMGAAALTGLGLGIMVWIGLAGLVETQQERNTLLKNETAKLENEIKEVAALQLTRDSFLQRKQKIEELQNQRFEAAKLLDDLNILAPEGVYLTSIDGDSKRNYKLIGHATSDSKVAIFMKTLPSTGVFETPQLTSITKKEKAQEFILSAKLVDHSAIKDGAPAETGSILEGN